MAKLVSINIPFYNSLRNELQDCLTTIEMFTHYPEYELVLVDDGSEDESVSRLAQQKADVYIRHDETEGIAKSRHDAVLASSGQYICTLDSDTIVTPYWLTRLVEKHSMYQDGGFKVYILGAMVSCWLGLFIDRHQLYHRDKGLIECSETGNACMLFESSLIDIIGNFDPELYNLFSDLDFCRRTHAIRIPGVTPKVCITPEVVVYHHGWVDPLTDEWVIQNGQMSTRAQPKFITGPWVQNKIHGLEIINERYGNQEEILEKTRADLSRMQPESF
jgi:GT2 family glycosyltransferase